MGIKIVNKTIVNKTIVNKLVFSNFGHFLRAPREPRQSKP